MSSNQLSIASRKNKFKLVLTHLLRSVLLPGSTMKCFYARQNLPDNVLDFLGAKDVTERHSLLQIYVDNLQNGIEASLSTTAGDSGTIQCMICLSNIELDQNQQRESESSDTDSSDADNPQIVSESIEADDTQIELPCKHTFHRKCIFQWLLFEFHCPHEFLELVEAGEGENKRVRVKCQLTQHEMLPRADVVQQHLQSKKFVKVRDWYCHDYSQYEPYIVPHRRLPKSLYCNVTGTILNRIPGEVERHVQGKRFKRMKQHVKIKVKQSDDDEEMQGGGDFDADAFEFENSQVIYSDDEGEEGAEEEDDEDEETKPKKGKKEQEEDDFSDLYPDEESEDEAEKSKDDDGDETMEEKPKKKRPAKTKSVPKKTRHQNKKAKKTE
ncbi:unnamed protein product [Phytophthora lilii]|uniref:Unnamed protein product n=1 Tax=Phytophthora lilii TaxID=2077276 RepID=A0A9W6WMG5_9STRA|nr:unnamed protein product [Phytophthora lilii]